MTVQAAPETPSPASLDAARPAENVLRVSPSTSPQSLASAISNAIYDGKRVILRTIGAGASHQAMKACAIARGFVAPRGIDLSVRPGFAEVRGSKGDDVSAMTFTVLVD